MKKFSGKVALVTGAAAGMGKATAISLARDGASVVAADINTDGLKDTLETIEQAGGNVSIQPLDAACEKSCVELVANTVKDYGKLDIVVNVAGITGFYHLHETTTAIFERYIAVNLTSVMIICREAMPYLKKSRGNIINFSSINARMPLAYHAAYDASKAGVLALTKSIAQEFASDGVRCNAVCPGGFDTPMNHNLRIPEDADFEWVAKLSHSKVPFAQPERIAGAVSFLASEDASFVNGEQIIVDGGITSII